MGKRQIVGRGLLIKNNKVLLVNKIGEPHFFLPGGRLEEDEGIVQCVKREINEELDKNCEVKEYLGAIEHYFNKTYEIGHFFRIEIFSNEELVSAEKELEFKWFNINELENIDIRPKPVVNLIRKSNSSSNKAFWNSTKWTEDL